MVEKEVDILSYLRLFIKHKYLVIITVLLFTLIGFSFYRYEVPVYTASSSLVVESETVGTSYTVSSLQNLEAIATLATSYSTVSSVVNNLNLSEITIEPEIADIVKYRIKKIMPLWLRKFLGVSDPNLNIYEDIRSLTFYYQRNINVKLKRGNIIQISATAQSPKIAADIANELGDLIITRNIKDKSQKITNTLNYLNSQLASVTELMQRNRQDKQTAEGSINYNEIINLNTKIESDQNTLSLLLREQEHLRATIETSFVSKADSTDEEYDNYIKNKASNEAKLEYIEERLEELQLSVDEDKERLNDINREEYYTVQDLDFALNVDSKIYESIISEKQKIELAAIIDSKDIKFLSLAYEPVSSNKTKSVVYLIVFFLLGFGVSFGLIELREFFDRKFKSTRDVEETLNTKVIGDIPLLNKEELLLTDTRKYPKSMVIESYRTLATNIKFSAKDRKIKSITFSSDREGTGKSYTLANLATTLAESGDKVLIVDVDLRRPNQHKIFKKQRKPGLTDLLAGRVTLDKVTLKIRDNLYLITAGELSYNPQSILQSNAMKKFIKHAYDKYDFVLFDSIPLSSFSDVAILASLTDASILIIDEKRSEKITTQMAKEKLIDVESDIIGVVLNKTRTKHRKYPYYYYYNYDYDYGKKK